MSDFTYPNCPWGPLPSSQPPSRMILPGGIPPNGYPQIVRLLPRPTSAQRPLPSSQGVSATTPGLLYIQGQGQGAAVGSTVNPGGPGFVGFVGASQRVRRLHQLPGNSIVGSAALPSSAAPVDYPTVGPSLRFMTQLRSPAQVGQWFLESHVITTPDNSASCLRKKVPELTKPAAFLEASTVDGSASRNE